MAIGSRRKKFNDGTQGSIVQARPTLPKALENAYLAGRAAEAVAKRNATPPVPKKRGKRSTLDEMLVLQIRALREMAGWSYKELAASFGLPEWKTMYIGEYRSVGHLIPQEKDLPTDRERPVIEDKRKAGAKRRHVMEVTMAGTLKTLAETRALRLMTAKEYDEAELRLGDEG